MTSPHSGSGAPWRLAARIARRDTQRRKGRTLLVVLLVATPVFGMAVASVAYRTAKAPGRSYAQKYGNSDIAFDGAAPSLPAGSRALRFRSATLPISTRDVDPTRLGPVQFGPFDFKAPELFGRDATLMDLNADDPLARGIVDVQHGRAPHPGEVLLSDNLARALHVRIGDTLTLHGPPLRARVAGIGRLGTDYSQPLLLAPGYPWRALERFNVDHGTTTTLVDLPPGSSARPFAASAGAHAPTSRDMRPASQGALIWGWVAGALLLAAVSTIIVAAFATSAGRQLVTIGQLGAAGANERVIRRTLTLQGSWTGLAGSIVGVGAALGVLTWGRSWIESSILHRAFGHYVISIGDLAIVIGTGVAAATIAASLPARTAARLPTLSALAGRRPMRAVPRWVVPVGAAAFFGGLALIVALALAAQAGPTGIAAGLIAAGEIVGGLLLLGAAACLSPWLVARLGWLAARARGSIRLALRGTARVRGRSAAVMTAIAVAGAIAVAVSTTIASAESGTKAAEPPPDMVSISGFPSAVAGNGAPSGSVPAQVLHRAEQLVPGLHMRAVPLSKEFATLLGSGGGFGQGPIALATPEVTRWLGLSASAKRELERVGALQTDSSEATSAPSATIRTPRGVVEFGLSALKSGQAASIETAPIVMTPEKARALGIEFENGDLYLGRSPRSLSERQRSGLYTLESQELGGLQDPYTSPGPAVGVLNAPVDVATALYADSGDPLGVYGFISLAVFGFALIVIAMGLSLSNLEAREEREVLTALGARRRTISAFAGFKAGTLALGGAVLAVPVGFVPVALLFVTLSDRGVTFPTATVLALAVGVPLVAAAIALVGSSVGQRLRPATPNLNRD
jgi:putative ABC transport system permease protein